MKHTFIMLSIAFVMFFSSLAPSYASEKNVRIAYVEWPCAVASSNLIKAVIEERLGHSVELIPVTAAVMWQSVALGEADAMVTAWLPNTHSAYLEKTHGSVEDLGPIVGGARLGWVVPDYVPIKSITELAANKKQFEGKIYGIDPGAGLMSLSEKAMREYDLSDFTLLEGSDAVMVSALADAIKNKKWIVVTGWSPHWMFGEWSLRYLEDPKQSLGGEEGIHTIVRKNLKRDMPDVYALLDKFSYTDTSQLEKLMAENEKKEAAPLENARIFLQENKEQVDSWLR